MKISLLILLCSSLMFLACKRTPATADLSTLTPEFVLQKNPCYGKCPAYRLTVYKEGVVAFDGKRYVEKYGLYTKRIPYKTHKALRKAFKKAKWMTLEDDYPSNIHDLPKIRITYHKKGQKKTVVGDINRPEAVLGIQKMLEDIADSDNWILREKPQHNLPDHLIPDQLIVALKPNQDINTWLLRYDLYNLKVVKMLDAAKNEWLLTYDLSAIQPNEMINAVKMSDDIIIAEFNKKSEQ